MNKNKKVVFLTGIVCFLRYYLQIYYLILILNRHIKRKSLLLQRTNISIMKVKKISAANIEPRDLSKLLDKEKIDFQLIQCVNWEEYPYKPRVSFRIAHTKDSVLLHFKVTEASVRARYGEDNGAVWTDSCVEFFAIPAGDGIYYNIECNCIGTILIGSGATREGREHAPEDVTALVKRWSSLGDEPFEERVADTDWEVALIVPYAVFFKHQITSLDGKEIKANFYKCGDELQTPHFLSWNPINIEKPDFHRPDFFGTLEFEPEQNI